MDSRARIRTWLFSLFVAVGGAALCVVAAQFGPLEGRPFEVGFIPLAIVFALAERHSVVVEIRREGQAITFTEIPLMIGLIFADPGSLVLARVIGAALALAFLRRLPPVKVLFNVGQFAIEVATAVLVFRFVLGSANPIEPRGWIAGLLAVLSASVIVWVSVSIVVKLAGAPLTLRSALDVLLVWGSAGLAEAAVALVAAVSLWRDARTWVLLLIIGGALGYFFMSWVRIRERHQALATLHGFTTSLEVDFARDTVAQASVKGIAEVLSAGRAVMLLPTKDGVDRIEFESGEITQTRDAGTQHLIELETTLRLIGHHYAGTVPSAIAGVDLSSADAIAARLPIQEGDGLVLVAKRLSDARGFDAEDVQVLETAAGHAASALRNAQLVAELRQEAQVRSHQALHDHVTDLLNSRALSEQLDGQLATGVRLVMMTVRVDSLREVNDTLGRPMGDQLLRQVAARLRPLGRRAWCARSGTDEFTLVVPGGQEEADMLAERVVAAFDQPVLCDGVALAITVGVGVALAPTHGVDSEILLRRASLAASRSRLDGTTVTTWASDRDPYDPQRLTIAADLRDAIPNHELSVHFQPQLDIGTGLITGVEALVRWDHPRFGQLRPDQFIAAAENTGAIDALTLYVVEAAARAGTRWHAHGWDLDVAVNLSARNLSNSHFADDVAAILDATGFDPGSLTLELTESSVMTESERAMSTLAALDDQGIQISIDDFGTGYSSLAHLRRLPVSEIKIDKSFVLDLTTNESDEAIVRSMIELGHNLGLEVVVEGVETVEVRNKLQELGSDRLQGYLLSRPLAIGAFETWAGDRRIRRHRPADRRVINLDGRR